MMGRLFTLLAAGTIGFAGVAYAASFGDVDANADGAIDQAEFAAAYPDAGADVWAAADANGDGMLTEDEHVAAIESGLLPAE